jgi:hypothetical protein
MPIAYLTDVEGQWEKVASFCDGHPLVRLRGDELELADGATFVFGGDAIDRGPHARRIVDWLTSAKERYADRVVLLAGNRDLNKMRLRRELGGFPHPRAPDDVKHDPIALLKWTFEKTMGAPAAFEHRRAELGAATDEQVVESYLADVAPDGALTRYLTLCTLAWRSERTLFVHGGVGEDSLCTVPSPDGTRETADVDAWIAELDVWYRDQLDAYVSDVVEHGVAAWRPIIEYQQPAPGKRGNPRSVVYSCLSDAHNDPFLPAPNVIERMRRDGISRLVVGHTPTGDVPAVLRDPARRFELVMADNNYSRVSTASRVTVHPDHVEIAGHTVLDDGRALEVSFTLGHADDAPVGLRIEDGPLIKAPLPGEEHLTFRYLPKYQLVQQTIRTADIGRVAPPYER